MYAIHSSAGHPAGSKTGSHGMDGENRKEEREERERERERERVMARRKSAVRARAEPLAGGSDAAILRPLAAYLIMRV